MWRYLNQLYQREGHTGFKLMYQHIKERPMSLVYLLTKRVPVVHLIRRNQLRVMISLQVVLQQLPKWGFTMDEKPPPMSPINLDTYSLIALMEEKYRRIDQVSRVLKMSRMPTVEVYYEDLLSSSEEFNRVYEFLGLPPNKTDRASQYRQLITKPYREVLSNYEEVERTLADTPFADLLSE